MSIGCDKRAPVYSARLVLKDGDLVAPHSSYQATDEINVYDQLVQKYRLGLQILHFIPRANCDNPFNDDDNNDIYSAMR